MALGLPRCRTPVGGELLDADGASAEGFMAGEAEHAEAVTEHTGVKHVMASLS